MKLVKQGLSLALLGAGLVAIPGLQATAAAPAPQVSGESVVQKIKREAEGSVAVSREAATGKIGFVRAARGTDLMPSVKAGSLAGAVSKAGAYLDRYSTALGARAGELEQTKVTTSRYGWTVSYEQRYRGVPVFGSTIRVNIDKAGDLTSVNGYAAPGLDLSVTPRLTAAEAAQRAIATVRANPPAGEGAGKVDVSGLKAASNTLSVYRLGATKGERGAAVLAYVVEVANDRNIRDMVFVDANTGKFVNRYSMVADALERHVIEANGSDDPATFVEVWKESDGAGALGALTQPQQDLANGTGEAYWLFQNAFDRDSYDGAGAPMTTVNNDGRIQCPNANWNGTTTNYCDGVTGDDTVAHEWGHAYTEYTSNLIYQWQSGAMNESFSDIWGETVDMINTRENESDGLRTVGQCSQFTRSDVAVFINSPAAIAKQCPAAPASFGPVLDQTGLTGNVVVGTDPDTDGGTTTDGCSPLTNAGAVSGNIVMVDRGLCAFGDKAANAQDAGATGLIVGNRDEDVFSMSGGADPVSIPAVMIGLTNRELIRSTLAGGDPVEVTMRDIDTSAKDDSHRWLSGESDAAFGGAIRDMWTPTCYGDPGKVSDAEYFCGTDDGGGVHSNSGVPNHGYALLVDGGTYNGVDVAGLGLDKAANIFWRTQEAYLTPTSDFVDLADSLDAACADLVAQPIKKVSTEPNTSLPAESITGADCAAVSAMSQAVELRTDPTTQCDFKPLLAKGAPSVCGKGFKTKTVWKEKFQRGLKKWTKSQELFDFGGGAVGHGYPWRATKDVPGKHKSRVAFAPDPLNDGSCAGDADDVSSRDSIRSQPIKLPGGKLRRMSFQHYMASEPGWDGGNVKISINGAGFQVIPASAYLFNKPNDTLFLLAEGNSNPMQGEQAFTGTDGGSLFGSWGKSIVNLNKVGAKKGDRVRLRFDMGRDGCNGSDGWYVDNIKVQVCKKKGKNRAALGRLS